MVFVASNKASSERNTIPVTVKRIRDRRYLQLPVVPLLALGLGRRSRSAIIADNLMVRPGQYQAKHSICKHTQTKGKHI